MMYHLISAQRVPFDVTFLSDGLEFSANEGRAIQKGLKLHYQLEEEC
jgi:hypothetical protein